MHVQLLIGRHIHRVATDATEDDLWKFVSQYSESSRSVHNLAQLYMKLEGRSLYAVAIEHICQEGSAAVSCAPFAA